MQAERELAMAKQQAELEKIRAQAGMAGAAGMASMAMQQQSVQQPAQQPAQQAMPTQPQMNAQQAMPMQQPVQQQMPQQSAGMDSVMLALLQSQAALQAQISEMRATQDASAKAELEMLKM